MTALTTLRQTLATALTNTGVWTVYSFPPVSPIANSIIIAPDSPYIEPQNNDQVTIAPMANFKIHLLVPNFDNQGDLATLESFMVQVMQKLAASLLQCRVGSFAAPTTSSTETGQMLQTEIAISILTDWS